ncbi:MAG: hypothetical protein GY775_20065 [Candidatus Scalindua sp.]|nr:hypothetical protein [Candidatus Scalindua sp.]
MTRTHFHFFREDEYKSIDTIDILHIEKTPTMLNLKISLPSDNMKVIAF